MITNTLKFCSWNIQGYFSRLLGNKFEDKDFLDTFKDIDVVGLTETHVHDGVLDQMNIPGFHRLKVKNQPKNEKSNKASKGIAVFVRENKRNLFSPVMMDDEDAIWIKIKKELSGEKRDIFISTCYLNPPTVRNPDHKVSKLAESVGSMQEKGEVIIQGDLNARTGNIEDTILPDKSDEIFEIEIDDPPPKRNSQDHKVDPRGQELLDMCKSLNLTIANGRKTGDPFGEFTCIKYNGSSVVDYLITSPSVYEKVSSMNVGEFVPWLSDHCPVFHTLEIHSKSEITEEPPTKSTRAPKHFLWTEESKLNFLNLLQTDEFNARLDRANEIDQSDPNLLVNHVSEVLVSAAELNKTKFCKGNETNDAPWFDRSCREMKENIKNLGKNLRKRPKDENLRTTLFKKKKEFKNLTKTKKIEYKNDLMEKMKQSSKNSKKFWKFLDKMEKKTNDTALKKGISNQRWVSHFKSIFNNPVCDALPQNTSDTGVLDGEISDEEIKIAEYILRNGKSPGFDSISNEMLQCLREARPDILRKIFNSILKSPKTIDKWSISMINPLHKSGSKMDPDNYRGISLISCFSKFFSAILNIRLTQFALDRGIFSKSQLGFLAGCRTADALLILGNLIEFYCKRNSKYIFGCFVDFKKAFDSIPRRILFQKLLNYGINGKFYDCLVNIYSNDIACIKVDNYLTPSFIANQGVKQGCILSPTLFNIFLADFQPLIETDACDPVQINVRTNLGCLIWADDILLLSKSKEGLQNMLSVLNTYSKNNGMSLNIKKTKIMVFNKAGRHMRQNFYFGKDRLDTTRQYKYLGFLVTPSGEINSGLKDLKDRALRAFSKLKKKMGISFRNKPSITMKIFRSIVEPILLYASDWWGIMKMPSSNPIETLFLSFCKQLLGVQKQTTNNGVLLELGVVPLMILAQKKAVKNWLRLASGEKCNALVTESFQHAISENLAWPNHIENRISEIGLRESFLDTDMDIHQQVYQRLCDVFHQNSFFDIKREGSKLRTYSNFKTEPGFEKYLDDIQCVKERTALTKLRLSNHLLMIEKGRHMGVDKNLRFCPFCPGIVEDEKHFITRCPQYRYIRVELIRGAKETIPSLPHLSDDIKFIYLMSRTHSLVSKFSLKAFELREFLLGQHKSHD